VVVGLNILLLVEEWIKSAAFGIWTYPKIFQKGLDTGKALALIRTSNDDFS